ncbi:hypothetical protein AAZX31_13G154300 [Glycine max]|uniref:Uncharacterized protein n=2 Tax=Glycine subgen. Soja TaxID=1462606 RepID=I1M023_SOYBN|nr:uncharacterized protein LOC100775313 [Glycine max]XP_028187599.1 uncharacterized protein LOC114374187 [Glycine soja]KAG4970849.1 hypothetical protein JHK85_037270 [Glycine max]KAG4977247.1 hypothetical protein JHK86_036721 [Glycine max]KAG5113272.1 hypothetical protein JHK82_036541 [Glycine max]KAG5130551.1 hypothetical protein JHK84_036948 [Glycine max]KAH1101969.1 hypothetical protein GYH30_036493 [Glycine max]|eukprot:XP_003541510.1 uncharacterized protein LOC100775313 [Glycine max]
MAQQSSPPRRQTPPPSQYLEVNCRSSGKIRRFAAGTGAGFAVALINRKLKGTVVAASHIEAVKDGKEEEPIAFGPTSLLSNFGEGWKLQTVTLTDLSSEVGNGQFQQMAMQKPGLVPGVPGPARVSNPISFVYLVKIMFAFILIFVLVAIFTLFLDNLPAFILFLKSIT